MTHGAEETRTHAHNTSYAVPLAIALIVGGTWLGWSWQHLYWAKRNAGSEHAYYDRGIRLCQLELSLRVVAIRRYAARTGNLPESLADCKDERLNIEDLVAWARDNPESGDASVPHWGINEPWAWAALTGLPNPNPVARPSAAQDLFGLPIIYERGEKPKGDINWVRSSDPLPSGIEEFLATQGGTPPAVRKPFALSSLFVRDSMRYLVPLDRRATFALCLLVGGMVLIVGTAIFVLKRWKGPSPQWPGRAAIGIAGIVAGVAVFFGWGLTMATCYRPAVFSSSSLSREERLELLDNAVRRGEVPEDVARMAREYIQKLP